MPAPYARLGRIVKPHGTQGEVTVALRDGLSFASLAGVDVWIVPPPSSGAVARRLTDLRPAPKGILARVSGIDDAAGAHELAGRWLLARGSEVAEADDEAGLIGYTVTDSVRGPLGTVSDVIVTGANDVLVVEGGPFGQVLIPVIDDVILDCDQNAGHIAVALLPGLIDGDDA